MVYLQMEKRTSEERSGLAREGEEL